MKILHFILIAMVKLVTKPTMFVAMLAWLLGPSLGYAIDTKVYPGASCQPVIGTDFQIGVGGIQNTSNVFSNVVCPIVTDNESITPGERVFIQVFVQSSNGQQLACVARNLSLFGNELAAFLDLTFSSFPTSLELSLPISAGGFVNNIFCGLPPGGLIFSYVVVEPKNENEE
jgi:hypothetical protein